MSGDDLAVSVFLWTIAVTVFGVEGWREQGRARWVSWICGTVLVAMGAFWPEIVSLWPSASEAIVKISKDPASWFFLTMTLFVMMTMHRRLKAIDRLLHSSNAKGTDGGVAAVNWAIWKQRENYNLNEFAKILAGQNPTEMPLTNEAQSYVNLLVDDIAIGKLSCRFNENAKPSGLTPKMKPFKFDISRNEALDWATKKDFDVSRIA